MLFVTRYLLLAICYMLSESFYLKLATACKNLFISLVAVRLVIFKTLRLKYEKREKPKTMEKHPLDMICDPLLSVCEFRNRNTTY